MKQAHLALVTAIIFTTVGCIGSTDDVTEAQVQHAGYRTLVDTSSEPGGNQGFGEDDGDEREPTEDEEGTGEEEKNGDPDTEGGGEVEPPPDPNPESTPEPTPEPDPNAP